MRHFRLSMPVKSTCFNLTDNKTTLFPRPSPLGRRRKQESLKSNADNYLNLEYLHVDADILIVFV